MKNYLLSLVLCADLCHAQQIDWTTNTGNNFLRQIYFGNQNIFLSGESCSGDGNCGLIIPKYSDSGQYESGVSTAGALSARCAGVLPDNGGNFYTVMGSSAFQPILIGGNPYNGEIHFIKFNSQNEAVWVKELPYCYPDVMRYDQNGLICLGAEIASQAGGYQVTRYDNAGNLMQTQSFGEGYDFSFDADGNLYLLGESGLSKYNSSGDLLWKHNCAAANMAVSDAGACYLSLYLDDETSVLRKLDFSGQIAWNKILDCPAGSPMYTDALQNLYLAGMYRFPPHGTEDAAVVKYNSLGDSLWGLRVHILFGSEPNAIGVKDNLVYVLLNVSQNFNTTSGSSFMVRISEPSVTGIPEFNKNAVFTVSPNPGNGLFRINSATAADKACDLKVYNMQGACLFEQKYSVNAATQEMDLSGFAPGIYILEATNNSKKESRKLIIE